MKHNILALLLCLSFISGCGPSPEAMATQTATAATAITITPSPIPTPLGGGNGRLMFFRDSTLYSFNITNQNAEVLLSQQQLMDALNIKTVFWIGIFGNISPDGKKGVIFACGDKPFNPGNCTMALIKTDLSLVKKFNFGTYPQTVQWSPDSQKLLIQTSPGGAIITGYVTHVIDSGDANFGKLTRLVSGAKLIEIVEQPGFQEGFAPK